MSQIRLPVLRGVSSDRPVLLGFASASLLHRLSFADVVDEARGTGYQRRFSLPHSLDFRRYIQKEGSTTIPLTFNLRQSAPDVWRLDEKRDGRATLVIKDRHGPVLSQVDCQHRLGRIGDLTLELPFMTFLGLSPREELEIFNVINGKAKGLSSSLLDYHDASLAKNLGSERPELLIALHLHQEGRSPWYLQLDLGGDPTVSPKRRASLRTMQKAVKRFLVATNALSRTSADEVAQVVLEFWAAVAAVLERPWREHRRHVLNKGIGVYALMGLLGDMWIERQGSLEHLNQQRFEADLHALAGYDWSTSGPLAGLGGMGGAGRALDLLRAARASALLHESRDRPPTPGSANG